MEDAAMKPATTGSRPRIYAESDVFALARRRARRHGILLRRSRPGTRRHRELGRYFAVNAETGFIEASRVRLEDAALDLGIILPGDSITPDAEQPAILPMRAKSR
jgi:hypothetical protein